jgi:hypothetical protein
MCDGSHEYVRRRELPIATRIADVNIGISLPQVAGQPDALDGLAAFNRPGAGDTVCAS